MLTATRPEIKALKDRHETRPNPLEKRGRVRGERTSEGTTPGRLKGLDRLRQVLASAKHRLAVAVLQGRDTPSEA